MLADDQLTQVKIISPSALDSMRAAKTGKDHKRSPPELKSDVKGLSTSHVPSLESLNKDQVLDNGSFYASIGGKTAQQNTLINFSNESDEK
jgi:hypothetical protein